MSETVDKAAMGKRNWIYALSGLVMFACGMAVMAAVGHDHHGFIGFLAPFLLIAGLVVTAVGMLLPPHRRK